MSFAISGFLNNNVFLAGTPRIRPNFHLYIAKNINDIFNRFNFVAKNNQSNQTVEHQNQTQNQPINENANQLANLLKKSLEPVAKGIRAKEINGNSYIEYKLGEVEWVEVGITLKNGQKLKVQYPKGNRPPSADSFE